MIDISAAYSAQIQWQSPFVSGDSPGGASTGKDYAAKDQGLPQGQDQVSISEKGKALSGQNSTTTQSNSHSPSSSQQTGKTKEKTLSTRDLAEIQQLKKRDADVRAHEEAHLAVAGPYARSGPTYTYETGPNGVQYAIGGEVQIDTSDASTPEATIRKMETVVRAALAPVDPSATDRQVAAQALAKELHAVQELQSQQNKNARSNSTGQSSTSQNGGQPSSHPSSTQANGLSAGNSQQLMIQAYQNMLPLA